jgi:hypothetical protein
MNNENYSGDENLSFKQIVKLNLSESGSNTNETKFKNTEERVK